MIFHKGEFDYWKKKFAEAFNRDLKGATRIIIQDDEAFITPNSQGPAEFILDKDEEAEPSTMPTIGPRFRDSKAVITILNENDRILFTNEKKAEPEE